MSRRTRRMHRGMKCAKCKRNLPQRLLSSMCINGKYTPPICGVCALELRNEIFGFPKGMMFKGEIAQDMYDEAMEYIDD